MGGSWLLRPPCAALTEPWLGGSGLLPLRLRLPAGGGAAQRAGSQPAAAAACSRESGTGGTWRRAALPLTARGAHPAAAAAGRERPAPSTPLLPPPGARRPHGPRRCPAPSRGCGAARPRRQPARRRRCITQACAGPRAEAAGGEGEGAAAGAGGGSPTGPRRGPFPFPSFPYPCPSERGEAPRGAALPARRHFVPEPGPAPVACGSGPAAFPLGAGGARGRPLPGKCPKSALNPGLSPAGRPSACCRRQRGVNTNLGDKTRSAARGRPQLAFFRLSWGNVKKSQIGAVPRHRNRLFAFEVINLVSEPSLVCKKMSSRACCIFMLIFCQSGDKCIVNEIPVRLHWHLK